VQFGFSGDAAARTAVLVAVAVIGGVAALGGAAVLGDLGRTTTVRQVVAPASPSAPASFAQSKALTINDIYRSAAPGVVQITSTSVVNIPQDPLFGNPFAPRTEQQQSLGSGFVIDKAGHIITNYHVVQGARTVQVSFSNGENLKAKIVGTDPSTDIAVLQVDAHSRALTPLAWGNSDDVLVGDSVVAIGNPFGYTRTVTAGIVSALDRPLTAPNNFVIDHAIQTDAALNHGNSGGPLLDSRGQVIGVNSQISTGNTGQQGNLGIGFAIPSDTVRNVVAQIIQSGHAEHALLGIRGQAITAQIAGLFHLPVQHGLLVGAICRSSGAQQSGLRGATQNVTVSGETWPLGGDVIVRADGQTVGSVDRLRSIVSAKKPGDSVKLEVYRDTKQISMKVKLGRQPTSPRC